MLASQLRQKSLGFSSRGWGGGRSRGVVKPYSRGSLFLEVFRLLLTQAIQARGREPFISVSDLSLSTAGWRSVDQSVAGQSSFEPCWDFGQDTREAARPSGNRLSPSCALLTLGGGVWLCWPRPLTPGWCGLEWLFSGLQDESGKDWTHTQNNSQSLLNRVSSNACSVRVSQTRRGISGLTQRNTERELVAEWLMLGGTRGLPEDGLVGPVFPGLPEVLSILPVNLHLDLGFSLVSFWTEEQKKSSVGETSVQLKCWCRPRTRRGAGRRAEWRAGVKAPERIPFLQLQAARGLRMDQLSKAYKGQCPGRVDFKYSS